MVDFSPVNNNLSGCYGIKSFLGIRLLRKTTMALKSEGLPCKTFTYCLYERRTGKGLNYDIYCKMKNKFSCCRSFTVSRLYAIKIFRLISLHRVAPEHLKDVIEDLLAC